jgi:hypothetical protein
LLEAIVDPIKLMIYPNLISNKAEGTLYLDDGETNNYHTYNQRLEVQFNWANIGESATLSIKKIIPDEN